MTSLQLTQKGFEVQNFSFQSQSIPEYAEHQVLIKLEATGLNPVDWKMAALGLFIDSYPITLGGDGSGIIEAVGSQVSGLQKGDRVFFYPGIGNAFGGTFGSYLAVDARLVGRLPAALSFEQGAAFPLVAYTAALAFYTLLKADDAQYNGKPLLIYGASSMVGLFAVQIARAHGRKVIAVASKKNHDLIRSFGASETIDYRDADWTQRAKQGLGDANQIIDAIGGASVFKDLLDILPPNGTIITTDPASLSADPPANGKSLTFVPLPAVPAQNQQMTEDIAKFVTLLSKNLENGTWKPVPIRVLPGGLNDVFEGLKQLQEGKVSGEKLVVRISDTKSKI